MKTQIWTNSRADYKNTKLPEYRVFHILPTLDHGRCSEFCSVRRGCHFPVIRIPLVERRLCPWIRQTRLFRPLNKNTQSKPY